MHLRRHILVLGALWLVGAACSAPTWSGAGAGGAAAVSDSAPAWGSVGANAGGGPGAGYGLVRIEGAKAVALHPPTGIGSSTSSSSGTTLVTSGFADAGTSQCATDPNDTFSLTLVAPRSRAMVSATVSRGAIQGDLRNGAPTDPIRSPAPALVHASDFFNYYPIDYSWAADPQYGVVVAAGLLPGTTHTALPSSYLSSDELLLQVGIQAPASSQNRSKWIAVVVDTPTSMYPWMDRVSAAVTAIGTHMKDGDKLLLVTSSHPSAPQTFSGAAQGSIAAAAQALLADGRVDLRAAMAEAYSLLNADSGAAQLRRVVLFTNGGAPPSTLDQGLILQNYERGIRLVGAGVGPAQYYLEDFLDTAVASGGGANVFLDTADEATQLFGARFDEAMGDGVTGLKVTVTIPNAFAPIGSFDGSMVDAGEGTAALADGGAGGWPTTTIATMNLGPGSSVTFRQRLAYQKCIDGAATIRIDVEADGIPAYSLTPTIESLKAAGAGAPMVSAVNKAAAIALYAQGLASVSPAQLSDALAVATAASVNAPNDLDLRQIASLIKANPVCGGAQDAGQ